MSNNLIIAIIHCSENKNNHCIDVCVHYSLGVYQVR